MQVTRTDAYGNDFLIVSPGIRPPEKKGSDDQQRTVDVEEAFQNGADHIVVGRPIIAAGDPRAAASATRESSVVPTSVPSANIVSPASSSRPLPA